MKAAVVVSPRTTLYFSQRSFALAAVLVLTTSQNSAYALDELPECVSNTSVQANIVRVINSQTVETAKGQLIRLAAVQAPVSGITVKGRKNVTAIKRASRLLTKLTLNKPVRLVYDTETVDRYNRKSAHIFVPSHKKGINAWVQAEMMTRGVVRTFPNTDKALCIKQLLQIEKTARLNKAGLWKNRFYQIIQADNLKRLNSSLGRLQLIEGRVQSVSIRRNRSYINFSKNWSRDFTVTLRQRVQKLFIQSGINIKDLAGKNIRIRGWLGSHNGPTIKLYHVAQIEIMGK